MPNALILDLPSGSMNLPRDEFREKLAEFIKAFVKHNGRPPATIIMGDADFDLLMEYGKPSDEPEIKFEGPDGQAILYKRRSSSL